MSPTTPLGSERFYRTLEFPAIRSLLTSFAGSRRGRARLAGLGPAMTRAEVCQALEQTREAVALLRSAGRQPYHDLPDIEEDLSRAHAKGSHLEPPVLLAVASYLDGARDIARAVGGGEGCPTLMRNASRVLDGTPQAEAIRRAILPSGEVSDDASPRLREIRRSLVRMRESLNGVMDAFLKDRETSRLLQDKVITTRNDRFVLLIKAEHRGSLSGIVHGASGSGQSLFVEPMAAVDLNNGIVARVDEERAEIVRILTALTDGIRARRREIEDSFHILGELDALQAKARLAEEMEAVEPQVVESGSLLDLRDARHPLLMPALAERLGVPRRAELGPVPVSLSVGGDERVLVISGPNTGGKTVALKTLGLLVLMAQSGLFVPVAPGSRIPVFASIFADIGDEQSIAANLSTFSAHLATIVSIFDGLSLPALVLLDEVGAGTDPTEGGALGVAIVEAFRRRGASVVATTHHGLMKTYAQQTRGVACASFGYDPKTYAPTYVLARGEAGRSLALEMAERLGLPTEVVVDARSRVDTTQLEIDELLRKLEAERSAAEEERAEAQALRASLELSLSAQRAAEAEIEATRRTAAETFSRELRRRGDDAARKAADAIRETVRKLEESRRSLSAEAARARTAAIEAIQQAHQEALRDLPLAAEPEVGEGQLQRGNWVRLRGLGVAGEVLDITEAFVEVAVSGKRLKVKPEEVIRAGGRPARPVRTTVQRAEGSTAPPAEVNLIGMTVDEALPRLDKILDEAALEDHSELRVIHGFGAGRLRKAVAGLLEGHPHVASFREGRSHEGGGGATIVELK